MAEQDKPHLARLGDTDWGIWREVALRSTGFPAAGVLALNDPALAAAADAAVLDPARAAGYRQEYEAATGRLSAAVRQVARTPRFREAVAWQNPKLVRQCLDKAAAGEPRNVRGRNHELTIASYLQRYCLKNDTIGFFGPVGWARWNDDGPPLAVRPGPEFLSRRTVYFEAWAIDAVARSLSAEPAVRPWLAPRRLSAHRLDGATLHLPGRPQLALTGEESELLRLADGQRCLRDIAAELIWSEFGELADESVLFTAYSALVERGLVRLDLLGPIEAWPERTLRRKLLGITDAAVRDPLLQTLDRLIAARDRVAAAAGDDAALEPALAALNDCFQDVTELSGERRPGETYAGRTLVYEDTVLGTQVPLGPGLREALAGPLSLLLDSARWLVAEVAVEYERIFGEFYEHCVARFGSEDVPLSAIMSLATRDLYFSLRKLSKPVQRGVEEFQRRWAAVLGPTDAGEVRVSSAEIAGRVAEQFPPRPTPWAVAVQHSPDLMLAAADVTAVERGEFLFVLGELHLSSNTMESRLFVEQHEDPAVLLAAAEADLGGRRVYAIPPKDWPGVSSRVAPPSALLSPEFSYWTQHAESVDVPGPIMPVVDLLVRDDGERLSVRNRSGSFQAPLAEVAAEFLGSAVVNAFKPVARGAHSPRIMIDQLVLARESWTFRADELSWAALSSEADRFLAGRDWRARHGIAERAYYKVPVEDKPTFVDFSSLVYVNILAKSIRRSAEVENGSLTISEMLPELSQLWLQDAAGERYTSELRIVTVNGQPAGEPDLAT
jgi:hypothetical protein